MRKNKIISGLVAVLAIAVLLAGCGGGGNQSNETTSSGTTASTATSTTQATSGDSLSALLTKAQSVSAVKYTQVITPSGGTPMTQVVSVKKNKMRMEMSFQGVSSIGLVDLDTQTMYVYMPAQNMAMKVTMDQASKPATQEVSSIAANSPKKVGSETIDGIACDVYEYNFENGTAKMWISKDHGLPVRVENTVEGIETTFEYKNYDFSDIPDSMFELPGGVQIVQAGQ